MKKLIATLLLSTSAFVNADVPHQFKAGDAVSAQKFNENFSSIDQRLNSIGSIKLQVSDCGRGIAAYDVYVLGTSISGKTHDDGKMLLIGVPDGEYDIAFQAYLSKSPSSFRWEEIGYHPIVFGMENVQVSGGSVTDLGLLEQPCDESTLDGQILDYDRDFVPSKFDCNDHDRSINPRAKEIAGDNIDNDCDGTIDVGTDQDNDGFDSFEDCDNKNSKVYPGSEEGYNCGVDPTPEHETGEMCTDGIDNDKDGLTDTADSDCAIP